MCVGEKRKLIIPADLGYGDRGAPPKIPGNILTLFWPQSVNLFCLFVFCCFCFCVYYVFVRWCYPDF